MLRVNKSSLPSCQRVSEIFIYRRSQHQHEDPACVGSLSLSALPLHFRRSGVLLGNAVGRRAPGQLCGLLSSIARTLPPKSARLPKRLRLEDL